MSRLSAYDLKLGTILGRSAESDDRTTLVMPGDSRDKHLYVAGATGSGKSMFLEGLIRQDILNARRTGTSIILLDPHGSLYDGVMNWLGRARLSRLKILPIDLRQDEWVVAYNAIRRRPDSSPSVVVDAFVRTMAHVWGATGTDQTPLLARWITNLVEVLYEKGLTLPQAIHLLANTELRSTLTCHLRDQWVERDWAMAQALSARDFEHQVSSTVNRLRRFVGADQLRLMFGQPKLSLDLRRALDEGWIILISLATEGGKVSRQNADLFGSMFLTDLWTAAQERGKRPGLRPCRVYVDEFQSFISPTIAENLDQSRGFGLSWTMAHQFPLQLLDRGEYGQQLWHSVMENASSKVVFRMSHEENLRPLAQWLFTGVFDPEEIKHVLYSTKVMGYREEERESVTRGRSRSDGGSASSTHNWAEGSAESESDGLCDGSSALEAGEDDDEPRARVSHSESRHTSRSRSRVDSGGESSNESWSEAETESTSTSSMLIPIMGKEISHVQFRSLEEQHFRAMAALFGQPQRQAVVRLLGMKAPVTIRTLDIRPQFLRRERISAYAGELYRAWDFCLPRQEALKALADHDETFLQEQAVADIVAKEPKTGGAQARQDRHLTGSWYSYGNSRHVVHDHRHTIHRARLPSAAGFVRVARDDCQARSRLVFQRQSRCRTQTRLEIEKCPAPRRTHAVTAV